MTKMGFIKESVILQIEFKSIKLQLELLTKDKEEHQIK